MSNYVRNKSEPDFDTICKIANYLNVSVDSILGRNDETIKLSREDFDKINYHENEIRKILNKYQT